MKCYKHAALWAALVLCAPVFGQNISEYRYWFDDNIATLVSTDVTAGQTLDIEFDLPTDQLSPGYHTLSVQVKDDNDAWSAPLTKRWVQGGNLTGIRYWVNDDLSSLALQSVTEASIQDFETLFDVSGLPPGYHKLTFQMVANNGELSAPVTRFFTKSSPDQTGWEYWFDDDVSTRIQETLSPPQNLLDLAENLNTSALSPGSHTVTWRSEDGAGNYSVPITYAFDVIVGIDELPGVESLVMYPVPALGTLNLAIRSDAATQMQIDILSLDGQVVSTTPTVLSGASRTVSIDVSRLASGMYVLRLQHDGRILTRSFTKM